MDMVPKLGVLFTTYSLSSEIEMLIWKTENVLLVMQLLRITKSKVYLKIITCHTKQDLIEVLLISNMDFIWKLLDMFITIMYGCLDYLCKSNKNDKYLIRAITFDEELMLCNNGSQKSSQENEMPVSVRGKLMLYIWWDQKGNVYYESLPQHQTLNSTNWTDKWQKPMKSFRNCAPGKMQLLAKSHIILQT